ncbi:YppF family protein [Ammoniphilus sp. CFH 90114]|uniref:YppF family protein n=1 Tax=Ammoniphilus sp. CFH 90114 TaxID=2493665 RepID=UPI00100F13B1|nr:YppF family protein [Ammoniphilus sp. CFH 90114]RXT13801.1 hypothetical protein EIZ39_06575 [Ammoniphilus sp. CFH 90114]
MTLEKILNDFIQVKQATPSNVDELLDFAQRSYILGHLCISQYQSIYRELNKQGARKPDYPILAEA